MFNLGEYSKLKEGEGGLHAILQLATRGPFRCFGLTSSVLHSHVTLSEQHEVYSDLFEGSGQVVDPVQAAGRETKHVRKGCRRPSAISWQKKTQQRPRQSTVND